MLKNIDDIEILAFQGNKEDAFNFALDYLNQQLEDYEENSISKKNIHNALLIAGSINEYLRINLNDYILNLFSQWDDEKSIDDFVKEKKDDVTNKFFNKFYKISQRVEEEVGITLDNEFFENINNDYNSVLKSYIKFKSK